MKDTLMRRYIREQSVVCISLFNRWETLTSSFAARWKELHPDRVVIVGSGSSYHAALMARPAMERLLGMEITCTVPSEAKSLRLCSSPLYLAVSQSGLSTNTYEVVQDLRKRDIPVAAVTESDETPVARAAGWSVPLPIGEEQVGAKTKGVTVTVMALILMAASVSPDAACRSEVLDALNKICAGMEDNLSRAAAWSSEQSAKLLPFRHLYVLGSSDALGAAREGALKLLETSYLPVSCYPLDEYVHGIQNALDENACLLCLLPAQGPDRERMLRLIDFARSVGACCSVIALGDASGDSLCLRTSGFEPLCSLEYLPALQTLADELSAARRIDTSRRRYPDFFSTMSSKLDGVACSTSR